MALEGKKIAFLVAQEGIEQVELTEPWKTVEQAGGHPHLLLAGGDAKQVQAFNHLDKADTFDVDLPVSRAGVEDYDGLVLPGRRHERRPGADGPGRRGVRQGSSRRASRWRSSATARGCSSRPDVVRAGRLTSWPSLQTDIRNAGAELGRPGGRRRHQRPGPLVTSRKPDDLPAFTKAIADVF